MIWYLMIHHLAWTEPNLPPHDSWTKLGPYTYETCDALSRNSKTLGSWHLLEQPYCEMEPIND